ncbi:hypothetical protein GX48_04226 [Paracoccidioides brasiliensis]|nr:hypothetical protein GX48_04226 [Paracoccidioides brasiliensis]
MIPRSLGRLQPRLDKSKIDSLVSSALWSSSPAAKSHGDKRVLGTSSLPKTIGFVVSIPSSGSTTSPNLPTPFVAQPAHVLFILFQNLARVLVGIVECVGIGSSSSGQTLAAL